MKPAIIAFIFLFMTVALIFYNIRILTYLTVISIFFPIIIPFMGRDAMTTGTLCILFLFFKYLIVSFNERDFIKEKFDLWIYLLIILGAISMIFPIWTGALKQDQIGPATRQYVNFFSGLLFFLVIKNYQQNNFQSNSEAYTDHIEKLLSLFLLLISLHILISISIKIFPSLGSAFSIFYARDVDILEFSRGGRAEIERIRSFAIGYESYGEILAALSPLVLYKIFRFRTSIWLLCLLLFCAGETLAVTRSGICLFIIGVSFSLLYLSKERLGKAFALSYILSTLLILLIYIHPSMFGDVFQRFQQALETYKSTGMIMDTINRRSVFIAAWDLVISNLSFFGNGLTEFNFHNLFLTTLHQKGIIGAAFFFVVLLYPALRLIKSLNCETSANKALIFSCLLSMALFLINETKFEFTRHASYQQICWGLFATYYLVSKLSLQTYRS